MTKAIKKISRSEKVGPIAFRLFLSAFFLLLVFHVFFVSVAITKAVDSERRLEKISQREYRNTELEKEYINLVGNLDANYARAKGFVEKNEKIIYVTGYNFITKR